MAVPDIALRSSRGVVVLEGPECYKERVFPGDSSNTCRAFAFSPNGSYFAWSNGTSVEIAKTDGKTWSTISSISQPKTLELQFSPTGKYIVCWELFTTAQDKDGFPNMCLYTVETGTLVHSFVSKKQSCWQPAWSLDEKIFGRLVNNEVLLYENLDFTKPAAVINCSKVAAFSLSPTTSQRSFVACHMPGAAGQPSFQKLFQYPKFEMTQAIASKTFFQGESVQFYWNERGNSVLYMTSSETDKTGTTYYGKQSLHFASAKGESSMVHLSKEGPIYDVAWSPKGTEFCVVYGIMPAKATLFNLKTNPIYEFGTAPRNSIFFSPNGNRLLLGGFGNLPGRLEVWDIETKKLINTCDAPNTTGIIWDPRSECFLSFTTAPRLRTDNGFKIWHCSGTLMHEHEWKNGELYEVLWQPGTFPASALANKKPKAVAPSNPPLSKTPYRPPAARGQESSFKVHDEDEKPHLPGQLNSDGPSKAALKQKKKRDARKAKKAEQVASPAIVTVTSAAPEADISDEEVSKKPAGGRTYEQRMRAPVTNDPDKDKKIKNIIKKLEAIAKLKSDIAAGKLLDVNQTAKIAKENDLLKELGELNL